MGITSAPEIYERVMNEMLGDIDVFEIIMDDILVNGPTIEKHNESPRSFEEV